MSSTVDATNSSGNDGSSIEYKTIADIQGFLAWESDDGFLVVQNEQSNEMALFDQKWTRDGIDNAPLLMHFNYVKDENVSERVDEMFARADSCSPIDERPDMDIRPEQDDSDDEDDSEPEDDRDEYMKVDFNGVIDTDVLDPFIRHAKELYSEYTVVINRYGWHIRVVESSNVTQMDARIHCDDFEQYDSVRDGPIGVSHESLEEMVEFVEATDGDTHMSIEDGVLTLSDGDRLFTDTELINPDSVRKRPERLDMEVQSSVTVGRDDSSMWDLTKFVRSNKKYTSVNIDVNYDRLTLTVGDDEDESHDAYGDASGCDIEQHYSMDMLYQAFKKPLKAHLTEVPYTFSFGEQSGENDTRILEVSREYDSESKLNFIVAPRVN